MACGKLSRQRRDNLRRKNPMAQRRAAIKKQRVDKKRRLHNIIIKTALKKSIKNFQSLLAEKKIEEAKKALKDVISKLDKAAKKKVLHKNTAQRRISRLTRGLFKASR